jgi:hypothetical protein
MTTTERMQFCTICKNRKTDFKIGLTCSLTNEKPDFNDKCESFIKDQDEAERKLTQKLDAAGNSKSQNGSLKPKRNIRYGILVLIFGLFIFLVHMIVGVVIIVSGISFIIRGNQQKKIIKENIEFNRNL